MMLEIGFVLLVLAPLIVAIPLAIRCRRHGTRIDLLRGLLAAAVVLFVWALLQAFSFGDAYCRVGWSTVIAAGIYAAVSSAHQQWVRLLFALGTALYWIIAVYFLYGVNSGYRDDTHYNKAYLASRESITKQLGYALMVTASDRTFTAQNITPRSPILAALPASSRVDIESGLIRWGYEWHIVPRWHTPLTGLYRVDRTPMRLWYPGGKVKDAVNKIVWHPYRSQEHYPDLPDNYSWEIKHEAQPDKAEYLQNLLRHTEKIVIRAWVQISGPGVYVEVTDKKVIKSILDSTRIRYLRDKQPLHIDYHVFFLSKYENYVINYERIWGGGSVIDISPVTIRNNSSGPFSYQVKDEKIPYIQAYPSPEFQTIIDRIIMTGE